MPSPMTPVELKKLLVESGLEVYRTIGSQVLLAERVRDNLIMDSKVAAVATPELAARAAYRAQKSDFDGDSDERLFARARETARPALEAGFAEVDVVRVPILDPMDRAQVLDTWYEVTVETKVTGVDELLRHLRFLMGTSKVAE